MKFNALTPKSVLYFLYFFLTFYSCSKDSDLFTEYVSEDSNLVIENLIRNDVYQVAIVNNSEEEITEVIVSEESNSSNDIIESDNVDGTIVNDSFELTGDVSIVLDVLANDTFENKETVTIIETTQPTNGEVIINSDNTLTFIPSGNGSNENDFSYTTEFLKENGLMGKETGTVKVSVFENQDKFTQNMGEVLAFPNAAGFGQNATGGRGGIVVEVTNLNDSGVGSFRRAIDMNVPRTIVFKVAGTIYLDSYLSIDDGEGDVTIAGQTAPGGGITIANHSLQIKTSNVIVRYIRSRLGDKDYNSGEDALRIVSQGRSGQIKDIIVDHCSISWGLDENLSIGGIGSGNSVTNVTIQNSIISENIKTGYGVLLWNRATNISFYKNLLAHNSARNIRSSTKTSNYEMVNNVVYGFGGGNQPTDENYVDFVGNVFITNPSSPNTNNIFSLTDCSTTNCPDGADRSLTRAYINDNTLNGGDITISASINPYLENRPIFNSGLEYLPNSLVQNMVLNDVGANKSVDSYDRNLLEEVKERSGSRSSSVSGAGGYPSLNEGAPYIDNDKDGMADVWEVGNGLNPENDEDASLFENGNGYTNLEAFLYSLTIN